MLNRTNRKLSANNTGLKFGTREFAVKAGLNLGNLTRHFAARLESVRIGRMDVRDQEWLDAILLRSYPAIPMRAAMPADSSPAPRPASRCGRGAGPVGQRVVPASPAPVVPVHPRTGQSVGVHPEAILGLGLGRSRVGRPTTARQQPLPRILVPDAAS